MAEITYMTNDYWAIKKGYTKFLTDAGKGYVDDNTYPTEAGLDFFREDAKGIIDSNINGTPKGGNEKYLRNLEYRMIELMIDEEQGRETEDGRPIYIPRDYLFARDTAKLAALGTTGFTRGVGH